MTRQAVSDCKPTSCRPTGFLDITTAEQLRTVLLAATENLYQTLVVDMFPHPVLRLCRGPYAGNSAQAPFADDGERVRPQVWER